MSALPLRSSDWAGRERYELQSRWRRADLERTLPACVPLSVRGVDLSWWRN
ncbi:MAG TPA: hypothetical protein VGR28_03285 [Candidatus Thermoplasmatota archaeon]|nr:hypothetical protein [Candidatus Thermoplasmatota archaeon]